MLGLAAGVALETEGFAAVEQSEHLLVAAQVGAMFAPTNHYPVNLVAPMLDPFVVVGADWIGRGLHVGRVGRAPGKGVEHDEKRVAPSRREVAYATQRRIELVFVGGYA